MTLRSDSPSPVVPIRPQDCQPLIDGLQAGTAGWHEVQERLVVTVRGGRHWHTEEWRSLRARVLRDLCDQCGAEEGPLTLQHLWHPRSMDEIQSQLRAALRARVEASVPMASAGATSSRLVKHGDPRPGCPVCGGTAIRERKGLRANTVDAPRYKCESQHNRVRCGAEFDEAPIIQQLRLATTTQYALWRRVADDLFARVYRQCESELYIQSAVLALDLFLDYMSGVSACTFCKRCAFLWDEKHVRLCKRCRKNWHDRSLPVCKDCLAIARRDLAMAYADR